MVNFAYYSYLFGQAVQYDDIKIKLSAPSLHRNNSNPACCEQCNYVEHHDTVVASFWADSYLAYHLVYYPPRLSAPVLLN